MPYAITEENDTIWARGRKFRALGLSSLFLLTANPALAHGAVGSWGGPVGAMPLASHQVPGGHTSFNGPASGFNQHIPLLIPQAHLTGQQYLTVPFTSAAANLPSQGLNLDLTSSIANIVLGTNLFSGSSSSSVAVNVGGSTRTYQAGQKVTAAEYVAIQEVLGGGGQTVTLNHRGAATGGDVSLNQIGSLKVSEVVIPKNVIALDNVSTTQSLSLGGDLLNYGSVDAVSTNSKITAGTISALDIINERGGIITTSLGGGSGVGGGNTIAGVNLTLAATNNIVNSGQISSGGTLTLAAGGSVSNAPSSAAHAGSSPAPSITAAGDVNLSSGSGNFSNAGLISSASGNVNFNTPVSHDININGTGGTVQALAGNINIRDASYAGSANTNLSGGDYLSQNLSVNSGSGDITSSVGQVSGNFNSTAGADHVFAASNVLKLGDNTVSGDPLFVNFGSIEVTGVVDVTASAQPLTVVASGGIFSTLSDPHAQLVNNGGDITLIAGANISDYKGATTGTLPGSPADAAVTIDFSKNTGSGNINLAASTQGTIIDTSSATGNAGNVTLVSVGSSGVAGTVALPGGSTINTSSAAGSGGNVTIIAGVTSGFPAASIGNINAQGTTTSGNVSITNAQPTGNKSSTIIYDISGALDPASTSTAIVASSAQQNAGITVGNISAASINLQAANGTVNLTTGQLLALPDNSGNGGSITINAATLTGGGTRVFLQANGSPSGTGNGGSVTLSSSNGLTLGQATGDILISATSSPAGGNGGTVKVSSGATLTFDQSLGNFLFADPASLNSGNGANITLSASTFSFSGILNVHAFGMGTGNGGSVTLNSPNSLSLGSNSGEIFVQAQGGATSGNGGTLTVNTGGTLNIDGAGPAYLLDPLGSLGNGGNLILSAQALGANLPAFISQPAASGGNGGLVSITQTGTNLITIGASPGDVQLMSSGSAAGGNGGTLILNTKGTVAVNSADFATSFVAAPGGGQGNGGSVSLIANTISISNGPVQIDASGAGTGNGGSVTVTESHSSTLSIGTGAGQLTLSANSGSTSGNAGTISVTSGGTVAFSAGGIQLFDSTGANSNFQGTLNIAAPTITLNAGAGSLTAGMISLVGGLTSIGTAGLPLSTFTSYLTVNSAGDVFITNGCPIILGPSSTPGALNISTVPDSSGNGSITIGHLAFISAGSIKLTSSESGGGSGGISQEDTLLNGDGSLNPTLYSSSIVLTDNFNSSVGTGIGAITVATSNLYGPINIQVNSGGNVTIADSSMGIATVGGFANSQATSQISVSAAGSLVMSSLPTSVINLSLAADTKGAGGTLTLPGSSITTAIDITGNGGNISLTADSIAWAGSGTNLSLNADGSATGNGGNISVNLIAATDVSIGTAKTGGDFNLSATGQKGGTVSVTTLGNINLDTKAVSGFAVPTGISAGPQGTGGGGTTSLSAADLSWSLKGTDGLLLSQDASGKGDGGTVSLSLSAPVLPVSIGTGVNDVAFSAVGGSTSGNGGTVNVTVGGTGNMFYASSAGINVSPLTKSGTGGTINIDAANLSNTSGAPIILNASPIAGANASGGMINITTHNDLDLGSFVDGFQLSAQGGSAGGNGGSVSISDNGFNLNFGTSALAVAPLAGNGSGGSIQIGANNLVISSSITQINLNASAKGTGFGGLVLVNLSTSQPITLGNAAGDINISATGATAGGISFLAPNSAVTLATTAAKGQAIPTGFTAAPTGKNNDGAEITLNVGSLAYQNSATASLLLNGNSTGSGSVGSVSLTENFTGTNLLIGTGPGAINLSASGLNGGTVSVAVPAGQITLSTMPGVLGAAPTGLNVSTISTNGNGGQISLEATAINWADSAMAPLILNVSGRGLGTGGNLLIQLDNAASAATIGTAAGDFRLIAISGFSGGNAGQVSFITAANALLVDTAGLSVNVINTSGGGGSISLEGATISALGGGVLSLDVSGKGSGNGGSISLNITNNVPVTIGSGAGAFSLKADGGASGGSGGTISIVANGLLTVDPSALQVVAPTGISGNININCQGIIQTGGSSLIATGLNLFSAGGGGIQLNTVVSGLQVSSDGDVSFANIGAVSIFGPSAMGGNFSLTTTPDVNGNGSITINQGCLVSSSQSIALTSSESGLGSGGISQQGGSGLASISAPTIVLSDQNLSGSLVSGGSNINLATAGAPGGGLNLSVNTSGNAVVFDRSSQTISLSSSSANSLALASLSPGIENVGNSTFTNALNLFTRSLTVDSGTTLSAAAVTVRAFGGNGVFGQAMTVTNNGTIQGNNVIISGVDGNDVTVANAGAINGLASSIYIVATPDDSADTGGNLFISGGGTISAGSLTDGAINLVASTSTDRGSQNTVTFSGNQNFNGTTIMTASGPSQAVVVNTGVTVIGNSTVSLTTPLLVDNGTLIGSPLTLNGNAGGVTIADSAGTLDLSTLSDLQFATPTNLVILAAGTITDSGNPVTVSTDGGNLTLLAGFNFTPSASTPGTPDPTTLFTIPATLTNTGSINLANTFLDTSGAVNGNLALYANGGSVNANLISTSNGISQSGNLTIIGQGVTIGLGINTENSTNLAMSGNVSISAASITTTGAIFVLGGGITGSTIGAGAGSGNIVLNGGMLAGTANVSLSATQAGASIDCPSGPQVISCGTLSMIAGGSIGATNSVEGSATVLNNISAGTSLNYVSQADSVTLTGTQSAGQYQLTSEGSGNIIIGHNTTVIGTTSVNLQQTGTGGIDMADGTGAINSLSVTLNTQSGAIGANNAINLTNTGTTTLNATSNGFGVINLVSAASSANITGANGGGFSLIMSAGGSISTSGNINSTGKMLLSTATGDITFGGSDVPTGVNIDLEAPLGTINLSQSGTAVPLVAASDAMGNGGSITVNAHQLNIDSNTSQTFSADSNFAAGTVGGTITVTVGTNDQNIGSGNNQLILDAIGAAQGGTVTVTAKGGNLNVDPSAISVGGTIAGTVNLTGQNINQLSSFILVASSASLTATTGSINNLATAVSNLTLNAPGGNAIVTNLGPVTLVGASFVGGVLNVTTTPDGSGNGAITIGAGATLTSSTATQLLASESGGAGGISQVDSSQVTTVIGPNIELMDNLGGGSGNISVTTSQGASPVSFNANTNGIITITTSSLTTQTGFAINGGVVNINGLIGKDLTINGVGLIGASNGNLTITSTPDANDKGGNLFFTNTGSILASTPNSVILTAATSSDGASTNVIEFTGGTQTITNGAAILNASGAGQAIIIDAPATVTANGPTITFNTPLFINNGTLNGTATAIFTPPSLAGTYASQNPIDISQLPITVFSGKQLTILSSFDIFDFGHTTLDLSSNTGNGGSLYLLAGFTFTPAGGIGSQPDSTAYSITGTGTGNISLGSSTINTSSSFAGGNGGNVYAYANGSVNIGTIVTSGSAAGIGGSVAVIGNGVTLGNVTTSGAINGGVNVSSASVALSFNGSGSSITVQNGLVFGGSFQPGTYSGDINVTSITASANSAINSRPISLNASGGGIFMPNGAPGINTNNFGTLIMTAGNGGIGGDGNSINTDAAFLTANSSGNVSGTGKVLIVDSNASTFTIIGKNTGFDFNIFGEISTEVIAAGASITATAAINLQNNGAGCNLTFMPGSTVSTFDLTVGTSGTLTVNANTLTANTAPSGDGGFITVANNPVLAVNSGSVINVNANASGNASGGGIGMAIGSTTATLNLNDNGAGSGSGGVVTLGITGNAPVVNINANATGAEGNGGSITVNGGTIGAGIVTANGAGSGAGGQIAVTSSGALTVGVGAGALQAVATSGPSGTIGGVVSVSAKTLTINTDINGNALGAGLGINVSALGANANGGQVNLTGTDTTTPIAWSTSTSKPLILNVNGSGTGAGGQLSVTVPDNVTATIDTTKGTIEMLAQGGAQGGTGGMVSANAGTLVVDGSAINVSTQGTSGTAGTINLTAKTAINGIGGTAPVVIQADGTGLGNGGTINVSVTNPAQTVNVGNGGTNSFELLADAGGFGGNGGSVTVSSGGNLTINPSFLSAKATGNGNGGMLFIQAGLAGTGNLLVTGSLSENGSGTGQGGTIVMSSQSVTPFLLGSSKALNGVQGTVSVTGGVGGNGIISAANAGGALIVVQPLTAFSTGTFEAGKNGALTISNNIGSPSTTVIALDSTINGGTTGKITAKTIQASDVVVNAGTPALALSVNTQEVYISALGPVTLTNAPTQLGSLLISALMSTGKSAGAVVVKSAANIVDLGTVTGTSVTLQSTSKTTGTIETESDITATTGAITLTGVGGIIGLSPLTAATTVTETASGAGSQIFAFGTITATGAKGAVTLTAAGVGGSIQDNGAITTTGKVAIAAAKGTINQSNSGAITSNASTVTLTSLNQTALSGALTGLTGVTLKATGMAGQNAITTGSITSANGPIALTAVGGIVTSAALSAGTTIVATSTGAGSLVDVENSLTATGTKGAITLAASGVGGRITDNASNTATGAISLTAAKGSVSQAATIITSNKGAVTMTAGNTIIQNGTIDAATNATLKTTIVSKSLGNSLSVTDIITTNGAVSVVGAGFLVNTMAGATITAGSTVVKPAKATVLIEDSNTSGGGVEIGAASIISTTGSGGGNINIAIGAPAKGVVGTVPAAATYTVNGNSSTTAPTSGPFFFGTNGISATAGNPASQLQFTSINPSNLANKGQVIFTTGKGAVNPITVDTNNTGTATTFSADPPATTVLPTAVIHDISLPETQSYGPQTGTSGLPLSMDSLVGTHGAGIAGALPVAVGSTGVAPLIAGRWSMPAFDPAEAAAAVPKSQYDWISDTEIASGAIPAVLNGGIEMGINPDVSTVVELEDLTINADMAAGLMSGPQGGAVRATVNNPLSGSISENVGKGKELILRRGSVVFAPLQDTLVHTPFGTVSICAKSLVLVISYAHGVAIYDLDDKRQAAVRVVSSGQTIVLSPGRSVVLTHENVQRFEEINPAQIIAYRRVTSHNLGEGRKAYTADFSAMSAAHAVLPLRQLMCSSHPEAKRITNRLLKTTAIISQMQGSAGAYQLHVRPSLSACAR